MHINNIMQVILLLLLLYSTIKFNSNARRIFFGYEKLKFCVQVPGAVEIGQ